MYQKICTIKIAAAYPPLFVLSAILQRNMKDNRHDVECHDILIHWTEPPTHSQSYIKFGSLGTKRTKQSLTRRKSLVARKYPVTQ